MKIAVLVARYAISGVPLAQVRLARAVAARGHEVDFIIGHVNEGFAVPSLAGIAVQVWNRASVRHMLFPLIKYLRQRKPDVVFSAEDHLNNVTLLAAVLGRSKAKISGSCRVTPFDTYSDIPLTKRWLLKQVSKALMWRADALTCVSLEMVEQYRQLFHSPPHVCVYNIVDDQTARRRAREPLDHPWGRDRSIPLLVAAGTLAPWKGFSDLIRAMKILSERTRVRLLLLGDGALRPELQALIDGLLLSDTVKLVGFVENPLKYYAQSRVFVLSSRVEGMPNVLVEAMMCGCTPVSTDCPTGPRELLQGGKYGYLVPVGDPTAMAAGIERALAAPISKEALDEAVRPFEEHAVLIRHFELLGL